MQIPGVALGLLLPRRLNEQFEPSARLALFNELAAHFRTLTPFPPELEEGISDEQFVQNVLEVVFGVKPPVLHQTELSVK